MSKSFAFLLLLCASCMLAGASAAQQPTDSLPKVASQLENQSADRAAWRKRMLAPPRPTVGCFTAKYPSEKWQITPCGTAPALFHKRRPELTIGFKQPLVKPEKKPAPNGQSMAGDGTDLIAEAVGGPITSVEGFFNQAVDVQTVTSVLTQNGNTSDAPGAYALQINAAPFSTPAACVHATHPSVCQGWLQFLFMNDDKGSFAGMEFWLFDFGATCPGQGSIPQLPGMPPGLSWSSSGNDCTFYSETKLLAPQPITELGQFQLLAQVQTGGQARGRPVRDRINLPTLRKLLLPDPLGQRPESERHKLNSVAGREDEGGPPAGRGWALQKGLDCREPPPDRIEHLRESARV